MTTAIHRHQPMTRRLEHTVFRLAFPLGLALLWAGCHHPQTAPDHHASSSSSTAATLNTPHALPPAACVVPLPSSTWTQCPANARARQLMRTYYESVLDWNERIQERVQPVPNQPSACYLGEKGHLENDIRPLAYAALVQAFLARTVPPPPSPQPSPAQRALLRSQTEGFLRYLAHAHVTGGGTCLNGKPWGDHWQSAMWARSAVLAGWLLWDTLPSDLRQGLARLAEHEADRFLTLPPKSSWRNDTGAEENAWNAQILTLAAAMMPQHPRAKAWDEAAKRYLYNTLSVANDRFETRPGDDGRRICDWVTTTNAHPDFMVENHGFVHVGYLKTSLSLLVENAVPYLLRQQPPPRACRHHAADGFETLKRLMGWDAAAIYISGNDWKWMHTQGNDVMLYGYLSLLEHDREAALLEATALDEIRRIQRVQGGYFNVRRDLESGGLSSTRMIAAYWAHAALGAGAKPVNDDTFQRRISGVHHFASSQTLVHRTPTKFASFTWSQKRMGLSLPKDGAWLLWPHFASMLGYLGGQDASAPKATLTALRTNLQPDGFGVAGTLRRANGVEQDFALVSPPGDLTLYIERVRPGAGVQPATRETGVIGLDYPLGKNERTLFLPAGPQRVQGLGGQAGICAFTNDWMNLDQQAGYIVRRWPATPNVMRHHDESKGEGRVPQLQEWISLIGDPKGQPPGGESWACLVTCLNQNAAQTAATAGRVTFQVAGSVATCRVHGLEIQVRFPDLATSWHALPPTAR